MPSVRKSLRRGRGAYWSEVTPRRIATLSRLARSSISSFFINAAALGVDA
jgi:hypothetical protein